MICYFKIFPSTLCDEFIIPGLVVMHIIILDKKAVVLVMH